MTRREPYRPPALRLDRLTPAGEAAPSDGDDTMLGALGYGLPAPGPAPSSASSAATEPASAATAAIPLRILAGGAGPRGDGPVSDAWRSLLPVHAGRHGSVRWRSDGHRLFGRIALDEAVEHRDLETLARRAYDDLFATLRATGHPHLLRIWNYVPRINAQESGLERYRAFNRGRQDAFLAAGAAAFDGAPAACGLGTPGGPLVVCFLAGRLPPVPVENPRQVSAYRYPADYGPRSPTFSRAALADAGDGRVALLVSGTASIVGHATRHAGDVAAQTRETVANLRAVIDAAHARTRARFAPDALQAVVYLRHAADRDAVRAALHDAVGADSATARGALCLQADICRDDLLVEIEAHAFAPGEVGPP